MLIKNELLPTLPTSPLGQSHPKTQASRLSWGSTSPKKVTRLVTWPERSTRPNPFLLGISFWKINHACRLWVLKGQESGPQWTKLNVNKHLGCWIHFYQHVSFPKFKKIYIFLVRYNPCIWLPVREEAAGFLLGKSCLLSKPTQRKHPQQNPDRYLFSNHNCWFLLSCWFLFRAMCKHRSIDLHYLLP